MGVEIVTKVDGVNQEAENTYKPYVSIILSIEFKSLEFDEKYFLGCSIIS